MKTRFVAPQFSRTETFGTSEPQRLESPKPSKTQTPKASQNPSRKHLRNCWHGWEQENVLQMAHPRTRPSQLRKAVDSFLRKTEALQQIQAKELVGSATPCWWGQLYMPCTMLKPRWPFMNPVLRNQTFRKLQTSDQHTNLDITRA